MSVENAKKFLEKMKNDSGFAKKIKVASSLDERKKIASDAGLNFTEADLAKVQQGELNDEELDAVAGGGYLCVSDVHNNVS